MLDLIIVGGGPAGISTALHLQHHAPALAERTVVLEKARYPRDKYCAGGVGARAYRMLERIGVQVDVPGVPIDGVSLAFSAGTIVIREPDLGFVIRRLEFDHALAEVAMERGLDVRQEAPVQRVETTHSGVRVHLDDGEVLEARAVVGADGVGGPVRRTTGFPRGRLRARVFELDTECVEGDPSWGTIHLDFSNLDLVGYIWDFPTLVEGRRMMCRGVYFVAGRGPENVRRRLATHLASKGLDIANYRLKPFAERGFEAEAPISRPHVLLVGEAAGIDICLGEGIPQAIAYGALAGEYLADAFREGWLGFEDWLQSVHAADVGRRFRVRHATYRAVYGPERRALEKFVLAMPDMVRIGIWDFAGRPIRAGASVRALGQLARVGARHGPGMLVRTLLRSV